MFNEQEFFDNLIRNLKKISYDAEFIENKKIEKSYENIIKLAKIFYNTSVNIEIEECITLLTDI